MLGNLGPDHIGYKLSSPASVQRIAEGPGINYVHPSLISVRSSSHDAEVIAIAPIAAGEPLVVYGGVVVDRGHVDLLEEECRSYFYQIAPGIWYGPGSAIEALGVGERINHSCKPNAGFASLVKLVALRSISVGESVTVDYATFQSDELDGSSFACRCGCVGCRGIVGVEDWKQVTLENSAYQNMQPFIQALIDPNGSRDAKLFSTLKIPSEWHTPWRKGELLATLVSASVTSTFEPGGVQAVKPIEAGEVIFIGGGAVRHETDRETIDPSLLRHCKEIDGGFIIGPRSERDLGPLEAVPFNSAPNIKRVFDILFVASRRIEAGEQISR